MQRALFTLDIMKQQKNYKGVTLTGAGGRYGGEGYGESYAPEYGGACTEWSEWPAEQHALLPQDKLAYPASGPCFTGSYSLLYVNCTERIPGRPGWLTIF